jgi:DNA-directed RNA polymerase alpha subunit
MEPRIANMIEENGFLKFTLANCNTSIANALRRIIISDIPTFVFRTFPYSENKAEIIHNTTRFHNEIIKQRLSCIPIHISDMDFPYKDYIVEVDVKNDTDSIMYVTTKDFRMKNIKTDVYSNESAVRANVALPRAVRLFRAKPCHIVVLLFPYPYRNPGGPAFV